MEDGLFLLIVIGAMLLRALGGLVKKGPYSTPAPRPRPRPQEQSRTPMDVRTGGTLSESSTPARTSSSGQDSATELLPEDLWAILTGQPVPKREPLPAPAPEPDEPWEEYDDEETGLVVSDSTGYDEVGEWEARQRAEIAERRREAERLEAERREAARSHSAENAPVVVSLERNLPTARQRHDAFHAKIDRPQPSYEVRRRPAPRDSLVALFGGTPSDLRRAILLQEILGKPKGLED